MRIDKFLKLSRIIKRRSEAKKACDNHCVFMNDKIAKSSDIVKPFNKIKIYFRNKILEIEILEIPTGNVLSIDVIRIYRVIKQEKVPFE